MGTCHENMATLANPITAKESEERLVRELCRMLLNSRHFELLSEDGERLEIPDSVRRVFLTALAQMQQGKGVAIVPVGQELTTKEAADILGVSRQYLVRLLERGELSFHKVGTHRRVSLSDLLQYRAARNRERQKAITRMARQAVEDGVYDTFLPPED